jgi:hypothetical protein
VGECIIRLLSRYGDDLIYVDDLLSATLRTSDNDASSDFKLRPSEEQIRENRPTFSVNACDFAIERRVFNFQMLGHPDCEFSESAKDISVAQD